MSVSDHYEAGGPYAKVMAALDAIAPDGGPVTVAQLTGFDDFHTAGRFATVRMGDLLAPSAADTVLDAGSGIGGPARYLADRFGCKVIGIDLTPEFVQLGRALNERTGLSDKVDLRVGDITATGLADGSVDHVWTQHVAMNIADREGLYREIRRVMKPGGRFALFDVIDGGGGELLLPVPWATEASHSHLVSREVLRGLLEGAGFSVEVWDDPTREMVDMLRTMMAAGPGGAPPLLNPSLFIDNAQEKMGNYFRCMEEGRTALALAVCTAT
ncbi:MAG TPA: class I SAM-dependent methyltransferase [Acidimicrobiales bacterium]|nr:class I SAM-dependent methyltransferase [Acidimicrobiales bacterium]